MENIKTNGLKYPFLYGFLEDHENIPIKGNLWARWQDELEEGLKGNDDLERREIFKDCISILKTNLSEHLKKPFDEPLHKQNQEFSYVISRPEALQGLKQMISKSYEMRIEYFQKKMAALKPKKEENEVEIAKQILAIYYLFEAAGGDLSMNYRADLARLIRFLTGRELENPKIENTYI